MNAPVKNTRVALNDFFVSVQIKAFRQAEFAVKNRDEALDLVQDAMEKLAKKYADQPENWGPLFQRILQNGIRDWYRKQKLRRFFSLTALSENVEDQAIHRQAADKTTGDSEASDKNIAASNPEKALLNEEAFESIKRALAMLPLRQQQAFILRAWWGHDLAETAFAMNCSQGSVKTHYSRATTRLKLLLKGAEEM